MHRFFVSDDNFAGEDVVLRGRQTHQVRNVLRMRPGDHIVVLDNNGWEYALALKTVGQNKIVGQIKEKREAAGEPTVQITLYQSLLKRDKFEWVLQKCTEIGVMRFVPLVSQHSVIRDPDSISSSKLGRWRSIILEAAEQSGRGRVPDLSPPVNLENSLASIAAFDCCLMASPLAKGTAVRESLQCGEQDRPTSIALFIGPEGGFAEEEVERCQAGNIIPIGLGQRILRSETAAVVATSLILYELGEMNT